MARLYHQRLAPKLQVASFVLLGTTVLAHDGFKGEERLSQRRQKSGRPQNLHTMGYVALAIALPVFDQKAWRAWDPARNS